MWLVSACLSIPRPKKGTESAAGTGEQDCPCTLLLCDRRSDPVTSRQTQPLLLPQSGPGHPLVLALSGAFCSSLQNELLQMKQEVKLCSLRGKTD